LSPASNRDRQLSSADPSVLTSDNEPELVALAARIKAAMVERHWTLASAESCTGGLVGHLLTEIAGSSDYYLGGLISYSNALKQAELGVPAEALARHGAVSAQTCVAMAEGARRRYQATLAVAVTGIAGPAGGTARKPVGLTYVAVADEAGNAVRRHQWSGDRHANKQASARACLELILERLAEPA
jgi:PncC family amidohydrolase